MVVDELEPLLVQSISSEGIFGARRALPVRVVFSDGSPTASLSDLAGFMWDATKNVNDWYKAASNGVVSFPRETNNVGGSRVEEVTISFSKAGCNPTGWADAVDAALLARGVTVSDFQHIVYFLPETGCSWAGLGNLGCFGTCRAWTNDYGTPNSSTADVVFHELGHNLTLHHARTDPDNSGTAACEYCDTSSAMGYAGIGYRGFTAHSQEQLGWLPAERAVMTETSQTFTMLPTEVNAAAASPAPSSGTLQLVRVKNPADPSRYYLLSMRSRIGAYASNLPTNFNNRVSIHWGKLTDTYTNLITSLAVGETYTSGAVSIKFVSTDGSTGIVEFTNGTAPTATPTPLVTGTPPAATPTPSVTATPSATPTIARTATPQPTPTTAVPGEPTPPNGTPAAPPSPPEPTATPVATVTPSPEFGIAAVVVRKFFGKATVTFTSDTQTFFAPLRKSRAVQILPVGSYQLYLTRIARRGVIKTSRLGKITVSQSIASKPQVFPFPIPR